MIDLDQWLSPLDGETPSGADLRNDPGFHELERLAQPQVQVVHDERNRPTAQTITPPDWRLVLSKAEDLKATGRDLRLLVLATRALANVEGPAGLAQGLTLIARTFGSYWESLHPGLRANLPPTDAALRRINALEDMQNPQTGILGDLRSRVLFSPRGLGAVTGRDLEQAALDDRQMLQEAASGLSGAERTALSAAHAQLITRIRTACAALADQSPDAMASLLSATRAAIAARESVELALNSRLDANRTITPDLKRFLERILTTLERGSSVRTTINGAAGVADMTGAAAAKNGNGNAPMPSPAYPGNSLPDMITSRDDVVKCLDLVVSFYDRTEPSSPIPHLARRVRRMVHMDFVELMEDLAPSGLKEFRLLAGVPEPKKGSQKEER